jgi:formate hydrogenlyase subunit 3/multisubunit Na+/H+ antiporter MnhD subunit
MGDYGKVYLLLVALLTVGGGLAYLFGLWNRRTAGPLAALASLGALVMAAILWRGSPGAIGYGGLFGLSPGLTAALKFSVGPFMGAINLLATLFAFCVILHSLTYWRDGEQTPRFYAFALWAAAGASVALCTRHLLVFLFAWELVTLMLYLLVGVGGPKARAGAAKTFSILGFSDVALILGIAGLFALGGASYWSLDSLPEGGINVAGWTRTGLYLLFLVAALAKAGAVPLHTWIPAAAEHGPIPTMALLPASLDKLLGIVLLARASLTFFELTLGLKLLLMLIGVLTIIAAVMMAMVQHDLRRLLSFHAVSQVGYMVLGIGTGVPVGIAGGLFHMINHAIYKSLLFLSGGAVESRTGTLELDDLGGLARTMPLTATGFFVGALAISGVPPLNGFVSKWMVYQGVIEGGGYLMPVLLALAVLGSALTLASFVKAIHSVFFGERSGALADRHVPEVGWNMLLPLGALSGLCVALGLGARYVANGILGPGLVEFGMKSKQIGADAGLAFETGLWGPAQAVILIVVGLVLGALFYWAGRALKVRRVRPFIAGEVNVPAPTRVSGTSFYLTVRDLPFIRGLYADAEGEAFDVYRVAGQLGSAVVAVLRKLHTGVLEVYVTWVVVGVAVVMALMFLLR